MPAASRRRPPSERRGAWGLAAVGSSGAWVRLDQFGRQGRPTGDLDGRSATEDSLVLARVHAGRGPDGAHVVFRQPLSCVDVLDHEEGPPEATTVGLLGCRP